MPYEGTDINPVTPYSDVADKHQRAEPVTERRHRQQKERSQAQREDIVEVSSEEQSEESPEAPAQGSGGGLDISA